MLMEDALNEAETKVYDVIVQLESMETQINTIANYIITDQSVVDYLNIKKDESVKDRNDAAFEMSQLLTRLVVINDYITNIYIERDKSGGQVTMLSSLGDILAITRLQHCMEYIDGNVIDITKRMKEPLEMAIRVRDAGILGDHEEDSPSWHADFASGNNIFFPSAPWSCEWHVYANHPSFVMLTFGNELCASVKGHERMDCMLEQAKKLDNTRLYANGSNVHYGQIECSQKSDFYTSSHLFDRELRGIFAGNWTPTGKAGGYINNEYPNATKNFDAEIDYIRQSYAGPIFGFEVGQFEVLPDFDELADFKGVSDPINYELIKEKVVASGLLPKWKSYVEATGELSRIGYREEVEAVL